MAGNGKSRRGFASMDPARQREIASKGGRAAHAKGTAHEWSSDEARVAGRKGGEVVSRDRAHMAAIGREGGEARGANARAARSGRSSESGRGDGSAERTGDQRAASADREVTRSVSREYGDRSSRGGESRSEERPSFGASSARQGGDAAQERSRDERGGGMERRI